MAFPSQWHVRALLLWLVLACLLPGVAGTVLLFIYQYKEGLAQHEKDTVRTAKALMNAVDGHLLRAQALAETLATAESLTRGDLARFHERARKVVATSGLAANIVLRKPDEQLVLNALAPFSAPLPAQPSREHVRRVFETGKPSISNLFDVAQFSHPIISVDVPVFADKQLAYSLSISVFPQHLDSILSAQNLPRGWVATVLDAGSTVVGRNTAPEKFRGNKATPGILQGLARSPEGSIRTISYEGIPLQTAYSRSPATNWVVAIGYPRQPLQQAMMRSLAGLAAGIAILFVISLILAWLMGGRIARSVRALTVPATALGRGEPVQVPKVHLKETAEVGAALVQASELLDQRALALQTREKQLAQAHARLRGVIDSSPALIYLKDLNGRFLLVNKTFERLIGTETSKVVITSEEFRQVTHEKGPSAADLQVLRSGAIVQFEEEISTAEGKKYFSVSKAPLNDDEGQMIGICAVAVDVTLLKNAEERIRDLVATLEKRVEQRTEELRVTNARLLEVNQQLQDVNSELEAFSYTVAHDLRAPLRGIQGFADALAEDYVHGLDETGQDYLQRIAKAAGRMERLIEDLLSFSRLSRMALVLGEVSLDEVLRQVIANLNAQTLHRKANIVIATELPPVRANRTVCLQIFDNLISNALKFGKPGVDPCVRIRAEKRDVEHPEIKLVRIWIEDNGIGIPAEQHQRIFRPFERLHGVSQYPGSGIGLAIVDKAVRRMHGQCGVESEAGAGSRFWIELPASTAEP